MCVLLMTGIFCIITVNHDAMRRDKQQAGVSPSYESRTRRSWAEGQIIPARGYSQGLT